MTAPEGWIERDELIKLLAQHGIEVTPTRLLRWHDRWLLPQPSRIGQGQGKGSRSYYPVVAVQLAGFIALMLRETRDLDGAGWDAWCLGFPVTPFARDYLLSSAETQLAQVRQLARLLKGKGKTAGQMRRKLARHFGPELPTLKVLPEDRFLDALSGYTDIELGLWRTRGGSDSRVKAIGTGLNHAISDWISSETSAGRLDASNPIVQFLVSTDIPDAVVAESASASARTQSLPQLIDWLNEASEAELESHRNEAMMLMRQCGMLAGSNEPLGVSPEGFLRFLRIRVLGCKTSWLWNAGIDEVLRAT